MFGNSNFSNNKSNQLSVNTRLATLYADDSLVSIGAWNLNLAIRFTPATGKNADGITQYAQDNTSTISIILTQDNINALLEGINTEIIPAIKNKESKSVAVTTGNGSNTKVLCVATENGVPYMYAAKNLMNGIANDSDVVMHHFSNRGVMYGYSYKTGSGTEAPVNTGFIMFVKRLKGADQFLGDTVHANAYSKAAREYSSNNNSYKNDAPKYEAPVNTFDGASSSEFLPFS